MKKGVFKWLNAARNDGDHSTKANLSQNIQALVHKLMK